MFEPFKSLAPRQQAVLGGAALGAALMVGQLWLPNPFAYRLFKSSFINGVGLGVGIGGGFVLATGLLSLSAQLAEGREADDPSGSGAMPDQAVVQAQAERRQLARQRRAALAVGGLSAVLLWVSVRTAVELRPDFSVLRRLRASGVKSVTPTRLSSLRRQTALGVSLGAGLLLAGTALNWMVEEFDAIVAEDLP